MMMSLFSVFDPVVMNFQFNWVVLLVVLLVVPKMFYKSVVGISMMEFLVFEVSSVFKEVSYPNYSGITILASSVFLYLMLSNLFGLFPFVFTATAHPSITLGMGLVFWLSFIVMGWFKNFIMSSAHLVPEGSPVILASVLVLVELISHLIRPFTLSVRLAANMMAGHLIMGLLASVSINSSLNFCVSVVMQSVLLLLELAVAVIQGFVFSILIVLYALDYYYW